MDERGIAYGPSVLIGEDLLIEALKMKENICILKEKQLGCRRPVWDQNWAEGHRQKLRC